MATSLGSSNKESFHTNNIAYLPKIGGNCLFKKEYQIFPWKQIIYSEANQANLEVDARLHNALSIEQFFYDKSMPY